MHDRLVHVFWQYCTQLRVCVCVSLFYLHSPFELHFVFNCLILTVSLFHQFWVSSCTASLVSSLISLSAAKAWGLSAATDVSPLKVKVRRRCPVWEESPAQITKPASWNRLPTAEVKHARHSLQSCLPWESLRRKTHATVEEKRRTKFVIEHSRSHPVPVFFNASYHWLHLNLKSDT